MGGEGRGRQVEVVGPHAGPLVRQQGAALLPGVQGDFGTFDYDVMDLKTLPPIARDEETTTWCQTEEDTRDKIRRETEINR